MKLSYFEQFNTKGEDGLAGACFELALHDFLGDKLEVSGVGKTDIRLNIGGKLRKVEVKTGAGRIQADCKGNSYVVFCPVVNLDEELDRQEAFIIKRTVFIQALKDAGLYRGSKESTSGPATEAIQTFWNRKLNKPHGKKLYILLDLLYERAYMTLDDYMSENK